MNKSKFYNKGTLTTRGDEIKGLRKTKVAKRVETHNKFYSTYAWQRTRARKLMDSPICEICEVVDILTPAKIVHHIVPLSENGEQLCQDNLMSICTEAHHRLAHGIMDNNKDKTIIEWNRELILKKSGEILRGMRGYIK